MDKLLTPREAAKFFSRSVWWVYNAIESGELKAVNLSLGKKKARWAIFESSVFELSVNEKNVDSNGRNAL